MTTKRPYAQPNAQRRSIYTDADTWAKIKALGKGNASAGIREAVRLSDKFTHDLRGNEMKLEAMDNGLLEYELVDETGETVAYMASAGNVEGASHIVHCVNNHERLVDALALVVEQWTDGNGCFGSIEQARALLAELEKNNG